MCGVRDQHLLRVPPLRLVICPDHHQPGELALRAGCRVQRDAIHAAHLGEPAFQPPHELEGALNELFRHVGVKVCEASQARRPLVDLGVVLHRARPQRVHPRVDREVLLAQANVMANRVGLGDLWKHGGKLSRHITERALGIDFGQIVGREGRPVAAGRALARKSAVVETTDLM